MEPGIFTQLKRFVEVSLSTADSSYITPASTENLEFVYPLQFSLPYFIEEPLNALNIWGGAGFLCDEASMTSAMLSDTMG
jgi:hypothetical protein